MSASFLPLTPVAEIPGQNTSFFTKVLTGAETKPAFEPLTAPSASAPVPGACGKPVVTLQRDGDIVSQIRIQCPCGQVIELDCKY